MTFFLLTLGSGFGLLLVHPNLHAAPSFLTGGAIYFFIAQAFGFAVGGHFAGRLIGPLPESKIQEAFRAEAHGFVAWAVTVLATVTMIAFAAMSANAGSGTAALYGVSSGKNRSGIDGLSRRCSLPTEHKRAGKRAQPRPVVSSMPALRAASRSRRTTKTV
ncbi:MAG: hypothetical protein WDM89_13410 [Rhizomicrobium sp.]